MTEINETDGSRMTPEQEKLIEEIREVVNRDKLDTATAFNILVNAVQVCFDQEYFNDVDRYLISKSLDCFREYVDRKEDIVIRVG